MTIEEGETIGRALHEIGQFAEAQPWFERAAKAAEQENFHQEDPE